MNRWELTTEIEETYRTSIEDFINELENTPDGAESPTFDLSDTNLNPFVLVLLLEKLGYEQYDFTENGWQLDYWYVLQKDGFKSLRVSGTAIVFSLYLSTD